jgi:hypothetical protein
VPYFLILPLFAILVSLLVLLTVISALTPSLHHWLPTAWRLLLWCTLGFLLANAILVAVFFIVGRFFFPATEGTWLQIPSGVLGGLLVFLGPFIASAAGVMGGAALAFAKGLKASRPLRLPRQPPG